MGSGHKGRNQHYMIQLMVAIFCLNGVRPQGPESGWCRRVRGRCPRWWPQWGPATRAGIRSRWGATRRGPSRPQWGPATRAGISTALSRMSRHLSGPQWGPATRAGISCASPTAPPGRTCLNGVRPQGPESVAAKMLGLRAVLIASMGSGHKGRNQSTFNHPAVSAIAPPQWGPATRAGIRLMRLGSIRIR